MSSPFLPQLILALLFLLPGRVAALTSVSLFPPSGASGVCLDSPLRITFDSPPVLGKSGTVKIGTADGKVVETVDLALNSARGTQPRMVGGATLEIFPILVAENSALIFPRPGVFSLGTTYRVTVDAEVFTGFAGVGADSSWSFSTKASGPSATSPTFTIAADGSGDFCTVQGAVDFIPQGNSLPRILQIKAGTYWEIVRINSCPHLSFRGQERGSTFIRYPNNNLLNEGTNARPVVNVSADDVSFSDLTIVNTTPLGGSQAEALRVNGRRCRIINCALLSHQDTFLINSANDTAYLRDCLIEGSVDFVWGSGRAVFQSCEIRSTANGCLCQMRTPADRLGAVFLDCRLTAAEGVSKVHLARIDAKVYPASAAAFVGCRMGPHILPKGWLLTFVDNVNGLRFWEHASQTPAGAPLDIRGRATFSSQISVQAAEGLRDLPKVLGGWDPRLP